MTPAQQAVELMKKELASYKKAVAEGHTHDEHGRSYKRLINDADKMIKSMII